MRNIRLTIIVSLVVAYGLPSQIHAGGMAEIQNAGSFRYVYMNFQKPWNYVPNARDIFLRECGKQGLFPDSIFQIIFDSHAPLWGIGFVTDKNIAVGPPLKSERFKYRKVARIYHAGYNDSLYSSVTQLISFINKNGYFANGPMVIFWSGNPGKSHDKDRQYNLIMPVRTSVSILITQIFLLLSVFICLFLAFFLFTYSRSHKLSNVLFAAMLVSYASGRIDWLAQYQDMSVPGFFLHINFIGDTLFALFPPFLLLFTQSLIIKNFRLKTIHLLHYLPCALMFGEVLFRYSIFDADTKISMLQNRHAIPIFPETERLIITGIAGVQKYSYLIIAIVLLTRYRKIPGKSYSVIENIRFKWLSVIIVCTLIIETLCGVKHSIHAISGTLGEIFANLVLLSYLFLIMYILYKGMQHKEIFSDIENTRNKQKWTLPACLFDNYLEKLKTCMETEKPYLNPMLTIDELAEKLSIPTRYLSIVINKAYNQNFFTFVNSYRIKDAQKLLVEDRNGMNILNVLYEVGFNSKSVFNDCFRKQTGLTPSEYRKSLLTNN